MKGSSLQKELAQLRKRAEQMLSLRGDSRELTGRDIRFLLHEIEVHAVELELQNEELQRTRERLESANARYTELFTNAPVGYHLLDQDDIVSEANQTAHLQLGVPPGSLQGRRFSDFVHSDSQDDYHLLARKSRKSEEPAHAELCMIDANGNPFDVRLDIATRRDKPSGDNEQRITVVDISVAKQLERRAKMFFAVAGHELRTPLTNISLALDLIISGTNQLPPAIKDKLLVAHRATHRLRRLATEILDLRNATAASLRLNVRRFDLVGLLEEAVEHNRPRGEDRGVVLSARLPHYRLAIDADEDRILQVVSNLLDNATRFSPRGETVEIRARRDDGWATVEVEDHGSGIPAEFQSHVFEPFMQHMPSLENERHRESAGLGLSICRSIVDQLGGKMEFDSEPGNRTVFRFKLPLAPDIAREAGPG